ncbi:hypothetical protein G9272_00920 [Streptomyces asoensis]|uniref:Uncharacterized protein n=1 Tax=Streptomyces asoensis TaxID=249586 RepID=A0A6M4WGM6_9ACTN|nr:hypothetical protein G9272_00920 [Streptomyces asoensis]
MKTADLPLASPGTMSSAAEWKTPSRPPVLTASVPAEAGWAETISSVPVSRSRS